MADTKNSGFSMAECIAIVIMTIAEISDTTDLEVQTVFDYMSRSVEGLSACPSNEEYAQAAATLWHLLRDGGQPHD